MRSIDLSVERVEGAAKVFCASSIRAMADDASSAVRKFGRFLDGDILKGTEGSSTVRELLEQIHLQLSRHRPDEYFYKSVLLDRIVRGSFRPHTVAVFNEHRVRKSRADLVFVRHEGVVYEVKTGLDDLAKAPAQIADYYSSFTHVNLVLDRRHVERALHVVPSSVGIMTLNRSRGLTIHRRSVKFTAGLSSVAMFDAMRRDEYLELLSATDRDLDVSSHKSVLQQIESMDPVEVHAHYMSALRRRGLARRRIKDIADLPAALLPAAYLYKMTARQWGALIDLLDRDVMDVLERDS